MSFPVRIIISTILTAVAFGTFKSAAFAAPTSNEAFYVEPMELRLSPKSSNRNSTTIKIFNKESQASRIRVDLFLRSDAADGSEQRVLTDEIRADVQEFLVPAGDMKEVRLRYHGPSKLQSERAYRIVIKQVEATPGAAAAQSLDLRFVYVASMYVVPVGAKPKLVMKGVKRVSSTEIEIDLENQGTAHQKLNELQPRIDVSEPTGRRSVQLSQESRTFLARQNFLPGSRRKITLQVDGNETLARATSLDVKLVREKRVRDLQSTDGEN